MVVKKVVVIHGLYNPFSEDRSTDQLADDLRRDGYNVEERTYNPFNPLDSIKIHWEIMTAPSSTVFVGHSFGGILTSSTPTRAQTISVNTIMGNDIKGQGDWLSIIDPMGKTVAGNHRINNNISNEILNILAKL